MHRTARLLWLEWMLANLIGYLVGALAVLPLAVQLAYGTQTTWLVGAVGGAALGGVIGAAQWLVLRRHDVRAGGLWLGASLVGGMLGLALGTPLGEMLASGLFQPADRETAARMLSFSAALPNAVSGAFFGLMLGAAQWLALHRPLRAGWWWTLANGVAWAAGMALGAAVASQGNAIGALLVTGLVAGAVTGAVLQWRLWTVFHQA